CGGGPTDGQGPEAPLLQASDGNFYGTAVAGGMFDQGIAFRLTPTGGFSVLHHFDGADGAYPEFGLIQADDGLLYGTTPSGGMYGRGTVFRMTLDGVVAILHHFTGSVADGAVPGAPLIQASD